MCHLNERKIELHTSTHTHTHLVTYTQVCANNWFSDRGEVRRKAAGATRRSQLLISEHSCLRDSNQLSIIFWVLLKMLSEFKA